MHGVTWTRINEIKISELAIVEWLPIGATGFGAFQIRSDTGRHSYALQEVASTVIADQMNRCYRVILSRRGLDMLLPSRN